MRKLFGLRLEEGLIYWIKMEALKRKMPIYQFVENLIERERENTNG